MQTIQRGSRIGPIASGEFSPGESANSNEKTQVSPPAGARPAPPKRWVPSRKAAIVDAVRDGFISLDEALERNALSIDEFLMWQRGLQLFGYAGLRVKRTKQLRAATTRFTKE